MRTRSIVPGVFGVTLLLGLLISVDAASAAYDLEAVFVTVTGESVAQHDKTFTIRLKNNGPDPLPAGYKVSLNKFDATGQGFLKQIGTYAEIPRLTAGQTQQFSFTETGPPVGGFFYKVFVGPGFTDANNANHRPELWATFVAPAPLTVALSVGPPSGWTCPGEANLNATAAGGPGGETQYQFIVYRTVDGAQVGVRSSAASSSFAWSPPSAGRYRLRVVATRGGAQASADVDNYDVKMPLTMSAAPATPGSAAVKVTAGIANASCVPSGSTVHFTYGVSPGGSPVTSTEPTWTSAPLAPGTYAIQVYAFAKKDGATWAAYDHVQQVNNYLVVAASAAAAPANPQPPVIRRVTQILDLNRAKAAGADLMIAPEFISGCFSDVRQTADGTQFSLGCPVPTGLRVDWRAYQAFRLANGWIVKSFRVIPGVTDNAGSELAEPPAVNTSTPAMRVHLWANGTTGAVTTTVQVVIEGPEGTEPYVRPAR